MPTAEEDRIHRDLINAAPYLFGQPIVPLKQVEFIQPETMTGLEYLPTEVLARVQSGVVADLTTTG